MVSPIHNAAAGACPSKVGASTGDDSEEVPISPCGFTVFNWKKNRLQENDGTWMGKPMDDMDDMEESTHHFMDQSIDEM